VYLDDRNTESHGFQPIAIVYSLPQALFVWALLLFSFQGFWMTFTGLSPYSLLSTLFPAAVVCACIWRVLHPRQKPFEGSMLSTAVPPPIVVEDQKGHHTAELMV
jgi:hypothetical protein